MFGVEGEILSAKLFSNTRKRAHSTVTDDFFLFKKHSSFLTVIMKSRSQYKPELDMLPASPISEGIKLKD
jgi:hypothetical protein